MLDPIRLKKVVVKGFTKEDIFNRCKKKLISKLIANKLLKKKDEVEITKINLLKQHGYGIND